jgi:hypothetical protein
MNKKVLVLIGTAACSLFTAVNPACAQGTAFTYQGRLSDGPNPANGNYDLTFALFNAGSGPSQVGGTISNTGVAITNGLFTLPLDFGNVFDGSARWLEIGVRTSGGGGFAILAPRQPLTPAPYAIMAESFDLRLPSSGTVNSSDAAFSVVNSGTGNGLHGTGFDGVFGESTSPNGNGVLGICNAGSAAYGVWGESSTGYGAVGTQSGNGNYGELGTTNEGVFGATSGQLDSGGKASRLAIFDRRC